MECTSKNYKFASQQSLAEAQAQGDGELRHMVAKLAAHVRPTCGELWAEAERLLNRTAPPSAPVEARLPPRKNERGADGKFRTVYLFDTPHEQGRFQQQVESFYQQTTAVDGADKGGDA